MNPKLVQIQLTPFLESHTQGFMVELCKLLLSAQETDAGIPKAFLEAQAEERRKRLEIERQMDESFQSRRSGTGRGRWDEGQGQDRGRDHSKRSRWETDTGWRDDAYRRSRERSPDGGGSRPHDPRLDRDYRRDRDYSRRHDRHHGRRDRDYRRDYRRR